MQSRSCKLLYVDGTILWLYKVLMDEQTINKIEQLLKEQEKKLLAQQNQVAINIVNSTYSQLEALNSLQMLFDIKKPMPPMGGWAVSPDLALSIANEILSRQPSLIVETGTGVSTIVAGYALKKTKSGKIISLEHDEKYFEIQKTVISDHDLGDVIDLLLLPLKEIRFNDRSWQWYDVDSLDIDQKIDMLIVDGPPGHLQQHSRYPALPVFYEKMGNDAVVIVDDTGRLDEQEVMKMWCDTYSDLVVEPIVCFTGAALIRKVS